MNHEYAPKNSNTTKASTPVAARGAGIAGDEELVVEIDRDGPISGPAVHLATLATVGLKVSGSHLSEACADSCCDKKPFTRRPVPHMGAVVLSPKSNKSPFSFEVDRSTQDQPPCNFADSRASDSGQNIEGTVDGNFIGPLRRDDYFRQVSAKLNAARLKHNSSPKAKEPRNWQALAQKAQQYVENELNRSENPPKVWEESDTVVSDEHPLAVQVAHASAPTKEPSLVSSAATSTVVISGPGGSTTAEFKAPNPPETKNVSLPAQPVSSAIPTNGFNQLPSLPASELARLGKLDFSRRFSWHTLANGDGNHVGYKKMADWLRFFFYLGQVMELCAIYHDDRVQSEYYDYDRLEDMARAGLEISKAGSAKGVYFTLNPVKPKLIERSRYPVLKFRPLTKDGDIEFRRWLLIDELLSNLVF
jgi:hypothetical protein